MARIFTVLVLDSSHWPGKSQLLKRIKSFGIFSTQGNLYPVKKKWGIGKEILIRVLKDITE